MTGAVLDAPIANRPIAIMRPGTFTDVAGQEVTFTPLQLAEAAVAYNRADRRSPLVIGHPFDDRPSLGTVGALAIRDGQLFATPSHVSPTLRTLVGQGRFRKVSASFLPPTHPGNPAPGRYYLKHVGFLGGSAPAVKGLGLVSFAEADGDSEAFVVQETRTPRQRADDLMAAIPGLEIMHALAFAECEATALAMPFNAVRRYQLDRAVAMLAESYGVR